MAETSEILRDVRDEVCTLTLHRPEQYNALSTELIDAFQAQLDDVARDETCRVVVIAGSGRAFCAGHDLKQMRAHPDRGYYAELFSRCSRMMHSLSLLPQPVIARVHGLATAAGCQLVASCDLAVAATSASFATSGINVGLFCATPAVPLTRNVARKRAFEMLVTGDFVDALTAQRDGLVNQVVPDDEIDEAVAQLVSRILSKPAEVVAEGKRAFYRQLGLGVEDAYDYASGEMARWMMSDDAVEGIEAFLGKRPPAWRAR